ncbi:MAG: prepilin-type N-terminal cleavage/methylation domain-containing protein [Vulcanimicrobiota bacterium]
MKRGFSLAEVICAVAVLVVGLLVVVTSFSLQLRHATQTRERQLAVQLAENLLEEITAHRYGRPKPESWGRPDKPGEFDYFVVIDGRKVQAHYSFYVTGGERSNGSFFGKGKDATDELKVVVQWREPEGDDRWEERTLEFEVPVWRQADVR